MAAALKKKYKVTPAMIRSGGGVFEVTANGKLIFSKKKLGRFPENQEIFEQLDKLK